ncbi:PAS domain S-box protein, partial [candidate division WOR-3 bacterium]|nr:PAS domain S-box protein [candidate division WOR-3 bacterium]
MKKTKTSKSKRSKPPKIMPKSRCKNNTWTWDEKYLDILKALPDIVYRIDPRGRFTFISAAVEALGYRADELIGKHFSAILHSADVKKTGRKYVLPKYKGRTTGDDHAPKLFDERRTGKRKTQGLEIRLKMKRKKELIYAEVIALGDVSATGQYNRPAGDETKKFLGTLGIIRDITSRKQSEAKLHYQADMLRHVSDAIISTDLNFNIRTWNQAAETMYGWKFTEVQGKPYYKFTKTKFPHDKRDDVIKQLFKREKWNGEAIQQTKNGRIIFVHTSCVLMKDHSNNPTGVVVVNRDITKLKRNKDELRQSEEKYRGIFDAAPDGILTVNRKGRITAVNKSYCKRTGYSKNEIIGKHISKIPTAPVKDIPGYLTLFKSTLKRKTPESFEYKCVHKNGSVGWSEIHVSIMKKDGKEMGFQAIVRDITKRKQAENALLESEERFRQFFENSPEYCYMISTDGAILDVNKTALKTLGYRKEELVGKSVGIIYAPESQSKIVNACNKWKKTGKLENEELKIISKNGEVRTVLLSANAVKDKNGTPLHTISIQKDITDQKKAQEALLESEKKYSSVVENSLDAIIIHQNRIIKFVNRAAMQQTGYSKNDFINKDIIQFIAPAYKKIVAE